MRGSGLSTFDLLGDMPSAHRVLMRLFLRRVEMTEAELREAMADLPEEKRLTNEQIVEALNALVSQGWIGRNEKNGQTHYTVQQQKNSR